MSKQGKLNCIQMQPITHLNDTKSSCNSHHQKEAPDSITNKRELKKPWEWYLVQIDGAAVTFAINMMLLSWKKE